MAARLAAGQRISTRPSASSKNGTKKSAAEQALLHYKGPTTKEEVEEQIALKREKVLFQKYPIFMCFQCRDQKEMIFC